MSAPAQKLGPGAGHDEDADAGVVGQAVRARRAAPPTSRAVIALRFSGRSMVRTATAPSRVTAEVAGSCSAEVVGGEGVALRRVAGLVPGQ